MSHSICFIGVALMDVAKNEGFGGIEIYVSGTAGWQMSMLRANMPTDVQMRPPDNGTAQKLRQTETASSRRDRISSIRLEFAVRAISRCGR